MTTRCDYATARERMRFSWHVGSSQGALRGVTGITIREFNLEPEACIDAYRRGRGIIREMFGEDVQLPGLSTPAISYGHANAIGSELIFPEGGEVALTHPYEALEQGIGALQEPVDFAGAGMAPFYLDFKKQMERAFGGAPAGFGFGLEGPLTTAYEMRGEGFFTDIFDDPPGAREFLRLLTESVVAYHGFLASVRGVEAVSAEAGGMADDIASMIPPHMFREFVLPYWERYYRGITRGERHAHIEDLRPSQLPFLEEIQLAFFDPSISPQLNPRLIADGCRVPFTWRLGSIHYPVLTEREIEDFVYQAAADGASRVHTIVSESLCNEGGVRKVHAFIRAARQAQGLLESGAGRAEIGELVSASGRAKFWDRWFK